MGKMLLKAVLAHPHCELAAVCERRESGFIQRDVAELLNLPASLGVNVTAYPFEVFEPSQVVIDFTTPSATMINAEIAAQTKTPLVVGTTGLNDDQLKALEDFAQKTVIVAAPNMSVGVNLLFALVEQAAKTLDISYDIEIVEMHHKNKVDAPSGTALGLGNAAALGRKTALKELACYERFGQIGARKSGEIGFATLRGGDVVGDHSVIFATEGERIELSHKASSREIFAQGALKAALWSVSQPCGLYTMQDVLNLK